MADVVHKARELHTQLVVVVDAEGRLRVSKVLDHEPGQVAHPD